MSEEEFQRQTDAAFRLVEKLTRRLLAHGVHPYAVSNGLISHGVTLLAELDGRKGAAEFIETSAAALRELDEAAEVKPGSRH